jgi:hypothetical protein
MVRNVRKFVVAALSGATTAAALGLLANPWDKWVAVASATLGAVGVYVAKNEPA